MADRLEPQPEEDAEPGAILMGDLMEQILQLMRSRQAREKTMAVQQWHYCKILGETSHRWHCVIDIAASEEKKLTHGMKKQKDTYV